MSAIYALRPWDDLLRTRLLQLRSWRHLSPEEIALMSETRSMDSIREFDVSVCSFEWVYLPLRYDNEIRLLSIHPAPSMEDSVECSIVHTRLRRCMCFFEHIPGYGCPECQFHPRMPDYEAISYTWGNHNTKEVITVDGASLSVTANYLRALRRLRLPEKDRVVWIDAVCIGQSAPQERNHQIGLMSSIYRVASRVVIFLGEGNDATDKAMSIICYEAGAGDVKKSREFASPPRNTQDMKCVLALLTLSWFKRIWVLQEVAWSWSATVICGEMEISRNGFRAGVHSLLSGRGVDHQIPYVLSF